MQKYSFKNDYSEGAHPNILKALSDSTYAQEDGYGEDSHSQNAIKILKSMIDDNCMDVDPDIHFISGGTQANLICLSHMLKPYESVIAAQTSHINHHEAAAIEATGHKINLIKTDDGKVRPEQIETVARLGDDEHVDKPKVVFISNSTEVGTHYTSLEIEAISKECKRLGLYLYMDGARLGSAMMAPGSELYLDGFTKHLDMFYIGGTKNGALLGEAIVILNDELKPEFRRHIKQHGGLLAKGRILGIQFEELFKDNLYFELARHANSMAAKLTQGIKDAGFNFLTESQTNQIFPIFPDSLIASLEEQFGFYIWEKLDEGNSAIRLVTSWATKEEAVDRFLQSLS